MAHVDMENRHSGVCEDCGAVVSEGKVGCQKLFEAVIARELGDYRYAKTHRLTVDAYSLQHPEPYMRSGKSFAAHLTGICAAFEYTDTAKTNRIVQQWLSGNPLIEKPARLPERRGDLTIVHVHSAADAEEHDQRVWEWARAVWEAWSGYHALARQLIGAALESGSRLNSPR
jgi:hypothetical protein